MQNFIPKPREYLTPNKYMFFIYLIPDPLWGLYLFVQLAFLNFLDW